MADYTSDTASARADIAEAGIMCQLTRDGSGFAVPALLTAFAPRDIDGELVQIDDNKALLPGGLERNPSKHEGDRLDIPPCELYPDGASVRIVNAIPLALNGQVILWELQLRK